MKIKSDVIKNFYIKMLIVILICSILITVFWIIGEYKNYSNEKGKLKSEYEEASDNEAKYIVNSAVDYIKYTISEAENDLRATLKDRTDRVYDMATDIYKNNKNLSRDEFEKIITDTVQNLKYDEGFNTYYISTVEGKTIAQNNTLILPNSEKEGYIEELWKDGKNDLDKKIIYMKKFEPLDSYICTEEFVNDFISKDTDKIFQWLNSTKFGYKNLSSIFVFDYEGNVLVNSSNKDIINKNIWNLEDTRGVKITQKELKIAKQNLTGGFINYYKSNSNTNIEEDKGAYVISIPQLKWVVGAEITYPTVEAFNDDVHQMKFNGNILYIILINIIVLMISAYAATKFKGIAERQMCSQMGEMLVDHESSVEKVNNELLYEVRKCNKKIKGLREKDKTTGVFNHEYIYEILKKEVEYSRVNYKDLSIVLIDIDHFKSINKSYGHDLGNTILNKVSELIKENSVSPYAIGRYDSNCFLVVMPKTNNAKAYEYAEKIRKVIREYQFTDVELSITISASLVEDTGDMPSQIINKCYELMQEAKENGGDRVERLQI